MTNLLEYITFAGKSAQQRFEGCTVIARYGSFKTYKIDKLMYNMNPDSYFFQKRVKTTYR
jgi:hypothetical protein